MFTSGVILTSICREATVQFTHHGDIVRVRWDGVRRSRRWATSAGLAADAVSNDGQSYD